MDSLRDVVNWRKEIRRFIESGAEEIKWIKVLEEVRRVIE